MIYGHKATLFTCKNRSAQGGQRRRQRNENEGGGGVRKRRANVWRKGWGYLRAYEGGKNDGCPAAMVVCKNVSPRRQSSSSDDTAFEYRLSLASIVYLPSSSPLLSPSPRFLATPSTFSPLPFILLSLTSLYIFSA